MINILKNTSELSCVHITEGESLISLITAIFCTVNDYFPEESEREIICVLRAKENIFPYC